MQDRAAPPQPSTPTPRSLYRTPALVVHGTVAELTQRNLFGPGRIDGAVWWRRTG